MSAQTVDPDDLLQPWFDALRDSLPELRIFDVHTHIGENDPDGLKSTPEGLLRGLSRVGSRAVTFPMHEPDGYAPANDRVLAVAAESDGRLVAFTRVNPKEPGAVAEARRCLDAGARGIKLHPRAEQFTLDHPEVDRLADLAAERRLPMIVHAGRGIPALGRHAVELAERHPDLRLILAHLGISDLAWIWRAARTHPNLLFDLAWWNPVELITLLRLVPPGQVLLASDAPYGSPLLGAILNLRCAIEAGLTPEQIHEIAGPQTERLIAGEPLRDLGPPPGPPKEGFSPTLERVSSLIMVAAGRMIGGMDAGDYLPLARLACEVGDDAPEAPVCRSVARLLDLQLETRDTIRRQGPFGPGIELLGVAGCVARAPTAALPADDATGSVGQRPAGD